MNDIGFRALQNTAHLFQRGVGLVTESWFLILLHKRVFHTYDERRLTNITIALYQHIFLMGYTLKD